MSIGKVLKILYRFLFRQRFVALFFLIGIVLTPIAQAVQPYFYKLFVDAIPSLDYHKLLYILIVYIAVRVVSITLHIISFTLGDVLTLDAITNLKETVFVHVHNLDFEFHTKKSSGSLISAIKRGDGAFWNLHFSIHYRLINVLVSFLVMIFFFRALDLKFVGLVTISFIVALIITRFFVRSNIRTRKIVNKQEDKITSVIVDNMINFETVKLFAKEAFERLRLRKINKSWKKAAWKHVSTFRMLDLTMGMAINTSIFLILLLAINSSVANNLSVGDFVLVVGFTSSFYPKIWELVWGFRDIAKNYSDIERYFGLLDYKVKVKDPKNPKKLKNVVGEIEYKNVSFAYENDETDAVSKINLKIRPGQSVAFVGRSGAGKTTMIKLLMRFFDVSKGSITIDGINIKHLKKTDVRSLMGVVPQEPVLFNNTLSYNIAYGRGRISQKEIVAASKLANIHDFIMTLPKSYKTEVGERGIKLSGGQKQRVAIARMILSDPEIVIFDEATSQLDSESERLIQDAFWKAVKNKTTIIIAHRLSTVMRADKIVVMEGGKIIEEGSHGELLSKKTSLYKHFWNLQTID